MKYLFIFFIIILPTYSYALPYELVRSFKAAEQTSDSFVISAVQNKAIKQFPSLRQEIVACWKYRMPLPLLHFKLHRLLSKSTITPLKKHLSRVEILMAVPYFSQEILKRETLTWMQS
jgi:predicted GTPase